MQTPSKVVEISPARGRDERSLKWIAMACVIVYLVSLGSIFGMAMMAVQASKEVHVSESGALVGADTGQPVAVDPITGYQIDLSYELPFLPMAYLANVASLEFKYVDANNVITPAAYQIHAVRKTAEDRVIFLTAVGDTITLDGSNDAASLEFDGVSHMIIMDDGRSATDKALTPSKKRYIDKATTVTFDRKHQRLTCGPYRSGRCHPDSVFWTGMTRPNQRVQAMMADWKPPKRTRTPATVGEPHGMEPNFMIRLTDFEYVNLDEYDIVPARLAEYKLSKEQKLALLGHKLGITLSDLLAVGEKEPTFTLPPPPASRRF